MQNHACNDYIDIGTGEDLTISQLTEIVALTIGYTGEIVWDHTEPDGTAVSCLTSCACTRSAGGTST